MPNPITDVDQFDDPVTTPANTELADEVEFETSNQQLANRTRWLFNRVSVIPPISANKIIANASTGVTEEKDSSDVSLAFIALGASIDKADFLHTKATDLPSATTTNLGSVTGMFAHITGTTTIDSFGTVGAGAVRFLRFDGVLTLTHNAVSLILPTAANIVTATDDIIVMISEGAGSWRTVVYQRASGAALLQPPPEFVDGHIFGLHIGNNAGVPTDLIDIDPGECASDDGTQLITSGGTLSPDITLSGQINALDTGSVANNTHYAVWLIADSTAVEPVASLYSLSFTFGVLTLPAGYDQARRVSAIRTDGSANILSFFQARDSGRDRWTYWQNEVVIQAAGTATTFTNTSTNASARVPPSAVRQQVAIRSTKVGGGSPDSRTELIPDGWEEGGTGMFWAASSGINDASDPTVFSIVEMPVGPSRFLRYRVQPVGDASATIVVIGWEDAL